jgi:apoptosis-inducing factor 2
VNHDNSINVELPDGTSETMSFDYLVLCTGFSYASPIKSLNSVSIKDRTKELDEIYEKVKNAKSVLVAGGGIVGCEVAGELAVAYGREKKIGICLRGDKFMH